MRSLAILHVDPERGFGGGETQVMGLLRHVAAAGQRQTLAADPAGELWRVAAARGIVLVPLPVRNHFDVLAGLRLGRLLVRERYDIVHFHTARAHALSAFLGPFGSARRVVTRRMDYRPRGGPYARWLYNRAVDAVVAISGGVREALVSAGVDPARIRVIASGVEFERYQACDERRPSARAGYGVKGDVPVLAIVGALEPRKGHAVLLEALARLRRPEVRVLCAGAGSLRAELAGQCARLGLTEQVVFLGRLDEVTSLLAAADVVVMPSLQEGLGVAVLEALAAARPVIASRVGGLPEVLGEGAAGVLVPPGDGAALAAAIDGLLRDPARARALGAAGRERVRSRFSMATMAEATLALYRTLAGAGDDNAN